MALLLKRHRINSIICHAGHRSGVQTPHSLWRFHRFRPALNHYFIIVGTRLGMSLQEMFEPYFTEFNDSWQLIVA